MSSQQNYQAQDQQDDAQAWPLPYAPQRTRSHLSVPERPANRTTECGVSPLRMHPSDGFEFAPVRGQHAPIPACPARTVEECEADERAAVEFVSIPLSPRLPTQGDADQQNEGLFSRMLGTFRLRSSTAASSQAESDFCPCQDPSLRASWRQTVASFRVRSGLDPAHTRCPCGRLIGA